MYAVETGRRVAGGGESDAAGGKWVGGGLCGTGKCVDDAWICATEDGVDRRGGAEHAGWLAHTAGAVGGHEPNPEGCDVPISGLPEGDASRARGEGDRRADLGDDAAGSQEILRGMHRECVCVAITMRSLVARAIGEFLGPVAVSLRQVKQRTSSGMASLCDR